MYSNRKGGSGRKKRESTSVTRIFSERLSDLIDEKKVTGQSQIEIAKSVGVPSGSLSEWADDKSTPTIDALEKLSRYFDVPSDYLLGLSNDPNIHPSATDELGLSYESTSFLLEHKTPENGVEEWEATQMADCLIRNFILLNHLSHVSKTARGIMLSASEIDKCVISLHSSLPETIKKEIVLDEWEKELKILLFDLSNDVVEFARKNLGIDETRKVLNELRKTID
jgi:transcriptional regulator with XRE-family HTH domain